MSALPPKADMCGATWRCPLSANSGHCAFIRSSAPVRPRAWAWAKARSSGLTKKAMTFAVGRSSCSNSNRFAATSTIKLVTPVTLPPGWFRFVTRPTRTVRYSRPALGQHLQKFSGLVSKLTRPHVASCRNSSPYVSTIPNHSRQLHATWTRHGGTKAEIRSLK